MTKIKLAVVGATGYTGMELLRLLLLHPHVEIEVATSEKFSGKRIDEVFPFLQGKTDLVLEALSDEKVAKKCTFAFSCLPHKESMAHVARWVKKGTKVVDLSADFRFESAAVYEKWYERHGAPALLNDSVYGLPELYREEVRKTFLVGNPGCYPTGTILGLHPLLKKRIIGADGIIVDAKSGVTGAGRSAVLETLYSEVNESVHAYKIGKHRHTPEIEQELSKAAGRPVVISFTPHLIPMDRGILSTMYARALKKTDTKSVLKVLEEAYKKEPFVRVLPEGVLPKTKNVRGTNVCEIGAVYDPRTEQVVVVAAIDNLMKGAASQAVQNMNLMCGLDETTGLELLPLVP